jgi:hypothetical protein
MIKKITIALIEKLKQFFTKDIVNKIESGLILNAQTHIQRIKNLKQVSSFGEVEFKIFSEWGEDGIIQYLINNIEIKNKVFVEFGVQNYKESNTRFLLINNLWKGIVIDSGKSFISQIKKDDIYSRYDLTAIHAFINRDNINSIISSSGVTCEIGLLSIDIDGNDYWVWEKLDVIKPAIIICEYNSLFGKTFPVSIPYNPDFQRTKIHFSNLYFGSSLPALVKLGDKKGYDFVGSNSAGSNAFFVRKDLSAGLKKYSAEEGFRESGFRQSRDIKGRLTYLNQKESQILIEDMEVVNTETEKIILLKKVFGSN